MGGQLDRYEIHDENFIKKYNRCSRYFYIPNKNLIIEVKSLWSLEQSLELNKAKIDVDSALGFDFKLEIRNIKGEKIKSPLFPLL